LKRRKGKGMFKSRQRKGLQSSTKTGILEKEGRGIGAVDWNRDWRIERDLREGREKE
jgi:hypothetical protein